MPIPQQLIDAWNGAVNFLMNIDWNNPSWGLLFALFAIASIILYTFTLGRDRIIVIMVAIYMALACINFVPYFTKVTDFLNFGGVWFIRTSIFLILFFIIFFFISRSALLNTIGGNDNGFGKWLYIIIFSFFQLGLFFSVILSFFPPETLNINEVMKWVFVSDPAKAVWILSPMVLMRALYKKSG